MAKLKLLNPQKGAGGSKQQPWQVSLSYFFHALSALAMLYLITLIVTTPLYIQKQKNVSSQLASQAIPALPPLRTLDEYQRLVHAHPLFGVKEQAAPAPTRSACDEFKAKYTLSGIITGGESEALFTSRSGNRTNFAKVGQSVDNVVIQAVQSQSVVISCPDKQVEIMMEDA